jgi:exopolyphosphatase/guanosine-5'-triphosphate,3'-diphosphate pyrophosphatase
MKYAVLDLGTNTFNLLVAESKEKNKYQIILNTKEGVKLGEGGINQKFITEAAFLRGISAISRHMEKIKNLKVDDIKAIATSAIRDATNGQEFLCALKQKFNLDVTIISGDTEAEMIYLGVKQTLPDFDQIFMILDIGGGSNEFIIADNSRILWKKSFPIGMARLLERFNPSDPINTEEINRIDSYLEEELIDLFETVKTLKPEILIGASGSFDSFVKMLISIKKVNHTEGNIFHHIPYQTIEYLNQRLIISTKKEREMIAGLEPVRKDMIVLASIFVMFVLKKTGIKKIYQSSYSLKEGAIYQMVEKEGREGKRK